LNKCSSDLKRFLLQNERPTGLKRGAQLFGTIIAVFPMEMHFVCGFKGHSMPKINNIIDFIEAGIKAESLRQKANANNVANLQTPGYRRVDVKFKELLAKALEAPGGVDLGEIEAQIYQPKNTTVKSDGNDVSMEAEIGEMIKNSLRYKTYVRLIQKKYQQLDLAINVR
jgi:flagellar basal-body rod protein FlgB